ncbi:MAG: nucleoside monophosphate kinase, partial [Candidatus Doudnabacteria bacterium]|nr:nucleoside monophosphate kinase [Candidatus Doudnabacteria bacterium]
GKGTQAKLLAEEYGLVHLSSGEALRASAKTRTPLGRFLTRQLQTGRLTPISTLIKVFEQNIKKIPRSQGLVLDGFARQITETRILLGKLKKLKRPINAAVFIDIPNAASIRRLSKRLQCDRCNRIYIKSGQLQAGARCPKCDGRLYQRNDDKPAAIRKRLVYYRKHTLPVIKFFRSRGLLIVINGSQSVARVHKDIARALVRKGLLLKK